MFANKMVTDFYQDRRRDFKNAKDSLQNLSDRTVEFVSDATWDAISKVKELMYSDRCNILVSVPGADNDFFIRNPACNPSNVGKTNFPTDCPRGLFLNFKKEFHYEEFGIKFGYDFYFISESHITLDKLTYPDYQISTGNLATIEFTYTDKREFNTAYLLPIGFDDIEVLRSRKFNILGEPTNPTTIWKRETTSQFKMTVELISGINSPYELVNGFNIFEDPGGADQGLFFSAFSITKTEFDELNPQDKLVFEIIDEGVEFQQNLITFHEWIYACGDIYIIEPPPPKKRKKDKEMCCEKNDQLLRLILKRIGSLPANVPDNFTKQNPAYINIDSLAELMLWQMQQLDALMGSYPIELEIEDTDLTKEGNQKQKISFPNQAELLAELMGMMISVKRDTHAGLITGIKGMIESGMSRKMAIQIFDLCMANAEYLGYKLEQKKIKVPFLFTPNGDNLEKTLQEKELEIVTYENKDKNDLQDDLKILKTMAARWNAQNFRALRDNNLGNALKEMLVSNGEKISQADQKSNDEDFGDFTEKAERGFTNITGIGDSVNPYGRPFEERPRIREIGRVEDKAKND